MDLVYLAKPIYGGWVTFTAHLSLKYGCNVYKITKRGESKKRDYGYNVSYQNLRIDQLLEKKNIMITACDKHYWKYLHLFPKNTPLVIHDPTELKGKENPLPKLLHHFKIITIRDSVYTFLKNTYNIESELKLHPFYEYEKKNNLCHSFNSLSISRIDFDKHTDLLLQANKKINDESNKIKILGSENRLYVHHKLKDLDFDNYWLGKYPKTLPLSYLDKNILTNCKYVLDMSIIKGDGGGTQYTFLEAIYEDCVLILHKDWVEVGDNPTFIKDKNCYVVGYTDDVGQEIADIINSPIDKTYGNILQESKKILEKNINVEWL